MKKSKLALLLAGVLSLFVFAACSNSSGGGDDNNSGSTTPSGQDQEYVTVTFDAGDMGYYDYPHSTKEVKVEKGKSCTEIIPNVIFNNDYSSIYEFIYHCKKGETTPFDFSTPIIENITLVAKFGIAPPSHFSINNKFDGTKLSISIDHKANLKDIDDFNYHVSVIDASTNKKVFEKTGPIYHCYSASIEVTGLTHGTKYILECESIYGQEHSRVLEETAYPAKSTKVLMLMYMDGDNNLNDPIFLDLNEVEYGLSKLSDYQRDKVTVLALWDGWAGDGTTKPTYGSSATRLLQLGADSGELYSGEIVLPAAQTLSETTIDLSDKADWLASGEVDMSDKNTLKNFLSFAKNLYYTEKSENIIIQFSNHGAGPRSIPALNTVAQFKGKEVSFNNVFSQRAMCQDMSVGGDTLLKTSDISSVLTELGYKGYKKNVGLIIEDLCLSGSLEEAYELKDNTSYYIGSPNNVPGSGMNYVSLITAIKENILEASFENMLTVANKFCRQYVLDYSITEEYWKPIYENFLQSIQIDEDELNNDDKNAIKALLSVHDPNMCTISLITTIYLDKIKEALDNIVDEISLNGNIECTKYFYDTATDDIVNTASETTVTIPRQFALKSKSLRPFDIFSSTLIQYQGNFSWLYDLGTVFQEMYSVAANEEWTALETKLQKLAEAIDETLGFAWRDGYSKPTYNNDILSGDKGWLPPDSLFVYNGLTISGETLKYTVDGDTATILNGDYPSWYTELKFGQDCKWNDLLKAWFSQQ